jgi:uncharacterized membrane protein YedE/YeeE
MRGTFDSTLPWWIAGPIIGLVIVALLALANKRFGVVGGVTDLVHGSSEGRGLRSWRTLLVLGMVLGGATHALLAGWPDAGTSYSWLDAHLSGAGELAVLFGSGVLIGVGARTAGGCTSGHGLTGSALASPASIVSMTTIIASAIATTFVIEAVI